MNEEFKRPPSARTPSLPLHARSFARKAQAGAKRKIVEWPDSNICTSGSTQSKHWQIASNRQPCVLHAMQMSTTTTPSLPAACCVCPYIYLSIYLSIYAQKIAACKFKFSKKRSSQQMCAHMQAKMGKNGRLIALAITVLLRRVVHRSCVS